MRSIKRFVYFMPVLLSFGYLVSCSGGGNHSDGTASEESIFSANASVDAVGFHETYPIEMSIQDEEGKLIPAVSGMFVEPGMKRFIVHIQGDPSNIKKVFVSDGGTYQREALKRTDSDGLYECDFEINSNRLYASVLIQVIHTDERASKKKFVFKTFQDNHVGHFVMNGMNILVSQDLLDKEYGDIAYELDQLMKVVFDSIQSQNSSLISSLTYGDGNSNTVDITLNNFEAIQSDTYPSAVIHAVFTIHGVGISAVSLFNQNLISTLNNDVLVDLYIAIKDEYGDGNRGLVIDLLGASHVQFKNDFFLRPTLEKIIESELQVINHAPLSVKLSYLFNSMSNNLPVTVNDNEVDLGALFNELNIDLSKYAFFDLYGLPGETDPGILCIGGGMYLAGSDEIVPTPVNSPTSQTFKAEVLLNNICKPIVDKAFDNIRQKYSGLVTHLTYGDNDPTTEDFTVNSLVLTNTNDINTKSVHANFTIHNVDFQAISLLGFPLIQTSNNDLTTDATFLLSYQQSSSSLLLSMQSVSSANFEDYFLGREVVEGIVKDEVANLEDSNINNDTITADMNFNVDISSCVPNGPMFPNVLPAMLANSLVPVLPEKYNLSCVIYQETINDAMANLLGGNIQWDAYELLHALLGNDFPGFASRNTTGEETIITLSVPPVLDLRSSQIRIEVDGVDILCRLNGEAQWEASVDLDLILDVRVINGELQFFLSSVPVNCHFHVMNDNRGNLGVFDHSNIVNTIVEELPERLGKQVGDPIESVSLDGLFPVLTLDQVDNPIVISANDGYLVVDVAAWNFDLQWLIDQVASFK